MVGGHLLRLIGGVGHNIWEAGCRLYGCIFSSVWAAHPSLFTPEAQDPAVIQSTTCCMSASRARPGQDRRTPSEHKSSLERG